MIKIVKNQNKRNARIFSFEHLENRIALTATPLDPMIMGFPDDTEDSTYLPSSENTSTEVVTPELSIDHAIEHSSKELDVAAGRVYFTLAGEVVGGGALPGSMPSITLDKPGDTVELWVWVDLGGHNIMAAHGFDISATTPGVVKAVSAEIFNPEFFQSHDTFGEISRGNRYAGIFEQTLNEKGDGFLPLSSGGNAIGVFNPIGGINRRYADTDPFYDPINDAFLMQSITLEALSNSSGQETDLVISIGRATFIMEVSPDDAFIQFGNSDELFSNREDIQRTDGLPSQATIQVTYDPTAAAYDPSLYEEPVVEEPVVEEPVADLPPVSPPIVEEPVVEDPVVEEPVVEEPMIEVPTETTPIVEEPVLVEPTFDEPVTEVPRLIPPALEEPVVVVPVIELPTLVDPDVVDPEVELAPSYIDIGGPINTEVNEIVPDYSPEIIVDVEKPRSRSGLRRILTELLGLGATDKINNVAEIMINVRETIDHTLMVAYPFQPIFGQLAVASTNYSKYTNTTLEPLVILQDNELATNSLILQHSPTEFEEVPNISENEPTVQTELSSSISTPTTNVRLDGANPYSRVSRSNTTAIDAALSEDEFWNPLS